VSFYTRKGISFEIWEGERGGDMVPDGVKKRRKWLGGGERKGRTNGQTLRLTAGKKD